MDRDSNYREQIVQLLVENIPLALERLREQGNHGMEVISVVSDQWWRSAATHAHRKVGGWLLYSSASGSEKIYLLSNGKVATTIIFNKKLPLMGARIFDPRKIDLAAQPIKNWWAVENAQVRLRQLAGIDN
jgi:hypothetical protein